MMNNYKIIEDYLLGKLSSNDVKKFEEQLNDDPILKKLLIEYNFTLEALRRKFVIDRISFLKKTSLIKRGVFTGTIVILAFILSLPHLMRYDVTKNVKHSTIASNAKDSTSNLSTKDSVESYHNFDSVSYYQNPHFNLITPTLNIKPEIDYIGILDSFMGVKWQRFNIDNTKDNRINLDGGTIIEIDSGILITDDGDSNLKDVNLKIKEFTNYFDLWQEDLHTSSNGNILISGGSCYIVAESNGVNVNVLKNKQFTLNFPGSKDSNMTIFYGNRGKDGVFDWSLGEKINNPDSRSHDQFTKLPDKGQAKNTNLTLRDTMWFLEPQIMDEGVLNGKYTFRTLSDLNCFKGIFDTICRTPEINAKLMFFKKQNLLFRFHLDSNGYFDKFDYNFKINRKVEKLLKSKANSLLGSVKIDTKEFSYKDRIVNVTLLPQFKIDNLDTIINDSNLSKMSNFNNNERFYNAIISSKFGYINCDHFSLENNLAEMTIHSQIGDLQNVKIFFKEDFSVANTTVKKYTAQSIKLPFDKEILIIGISKDGSTMFIKETKTCKQTNSGKGEPFNALKIKDMLLAYRRV